MSKRASVMPAAPPTPVHFVIDREHGVGPVVMADAVAVVGTYPVTISGDSVVHPRSRLDARGGPVNIGRRCVVEERAVVGGAGLSGGSSLPGSSPAAAPPEGSVSLGDYVSVETGAILEAGTAVGQGSVIGQRSQIHTGAVIGRYCTLAPRTTVATGERIPDFTVVYGAGRRRQDGRPMAVETRHRQQKRKIEVLRKLITSVPEKYMAR